MKTKRLILAFALVSLFAGGALFAAEETKAEPAAKPAKCCAKKAEAGEACTHECCVEAAKAGNNCEKCKGTGKIADNPVEHEHKK